MKANYDNDCIILEMTRADLRNIVKMVREGFLYVPFDLDCINIKDGLTGVLQDMAAQRVPRDEIMEVTI